MGIGQAREPGGIEILVPKATVEALDKGVLDRLARIDQVQLNVVIVRPLIEDVFG